MIGRRIFGAATLTLAVLSLLLGCDAYDASLLGPVSSPGPRADPACGDGVVQDDELCDIAIQAGMEGACPVDCSSDDPCFRQVMAGHDCQALCVGLAITMAISDDGCCPPGVGPGEDSDCGSCGDGIVGPHEKCDPPGSCPTSEVCSQASACVLGTFSGDASKCTAQCRYDLLSTCAGGDGCCPAGCNSDSDSDCSASCGNGVVETAAGETCEAGDELFPCPTTCDDGIACTTDLISGSPENCNVVCTNIAIVTPADGDGCCPPGAHALNDSDCPPRCGNAVREGGETCDPCPTSCDDGDPCTVDQLSGSPSACSAVCSHTPIAQPVDGDGCCPSTANANDDSDCSPQCGNGVREAGEACDGGGLCRDCTLLFPSSLVHRYSFDGTGTTVTDSVGTADGVAINCSVSMSRVDFAANVTDNYVEFPAGILSQLSAVTIEAWLKWDGGNSTQRIFDFGNSSGGYGTSYFFLGPKNSAGHLGAYLNFTGTANDSSADWIAQDSAALSTTGIHHVAVTFDGGTLELYLDGALKDAVSKSGHALSQIDDQQNWLARGQFSSAAELDGQIYEFRIYSAALSASAIQTSYNAGQDP